MIISVILTFMMYYLTYYIHVNMKRYQIYNFLAWGNLICSDEAELTRICFSLGECDIIYNCRERNVGI